MSTKNAVVRPHNPFRLPFYNIRNISCPDDTENERKTYVGSSPVAGIIDLPTNENVRDYLLEAEGRKRRIPTQVHKAIEETLTNTPEIFSALNSGVVIVARYCEIDEKGKVAILENPSIINGAQTQGVIEDFYKKNKDADRSRPHIKFEIIVTDDEDLIAEISIARNFQNDVMALSIAGRRGQLDELDKCLQAQSPELKLQKSETKLSEDYVKTERLLQVIAALIPEVLWPKDKEFSKVYAYSMKAKCLKDFQALYDQAKDKKHPNHQYALALYQFYLDIAAQAYELHDKWKSHSGFKGTGLWSIVREGSAIVDVPDGIIFPILASLSAFAKKKRDKWAIEPPTIFNDEELIRSAKSVYQDIAKSNPNVMGKSKSCYAALYQITSIYKKLSK